MIAEVAQNIHPDGINAQLIRLRDTIVKAHQAFTELEQKTSSICKPMAVKENCWKDTDNGSELQRFLKYQNDSLTALLERIEFIHESIDL